MREGQRRVVPVEDRDGPAGAKDATSLGQHPARVVHVADQGVQDDHVELGLGPGQVVRVPVVYSTFSESPSCAVSSRARSTSAALWSIPTKDTAGSTVRFRARTSTPVPHPRASSRQGGDVGRRSK